MIQYALTKDALLRKIDEEKADWRERALKRTKKFRKSGSYKESSSIWSEIKPVFMRLQANKCAYCERLLESGEYGKIEHDLEHFRPKKNVRKWPTEALKEERGLEFDFDLGDDWPQGYFLLAYSPFNYLTSCKPCNTMLKSDFFPIEGPRGPQSDDPETLAGELPLLIHPLGEWGEDPEQLITYYGYLAIPNAPKGTREHRRARVTIDFFDLNREALSHQRGQQIRHTHVALRLKSTGNERDISVAEKTLADLRSEKSPHTACVRAFIKKYEENQDEAQEIFDLVDEYLDSQEQSP